MHVPQVQGPEVTISPNTFGRQNTVHDHVIIDFVDTFHAQCSYLHHLHVNMPEGQVNRSFTVQLLKDRAEYARIHESPMQGKCFLKRNKRVPLNLLQVNLSYILSVGLKGPIKSPTLPAL
jgi:hypothetical protein